MRNSRVLEAQEVHQVPAMDGMQATTTAAAGRCFFLLAVVIAGLAVLLVSRQAFAGPEPQATIPGDSGFSAVSRTLDREGRGISSLVDSSDFPEQKAPSSTLSKTPEPARALLRTYWSVSREKDYLPAIHADISTWTEETRQLQMETRLGPGRQFALGWLDGHIRQKNGIFGDLDFNVKRQGPFVHVDWPLTDALAASVRLRDERFSDDRDAGFYKVGDAAHLYTGYLALALTQESFWVRANHSREREPDPVYDTPGNRSVLNIQAKELTGLAVGRRLGGQWEAGASIYREHYGSARADQWNINAQATWWPAGFSGTRISLGTGYYTEEDEGIVNLAAGREWRPFPGMGARIEYQLEYSRKKSSWLHQGDILVRWAMGARLFLVIRAGYGKENGGDQDENLTAQASLDLLL